MDEFIPKQPLKMDLYDEYESLIPIKKFNVPLYDPYQSLIPIKVNTDMYDKTEQLVPKIVKKASEYDFKSSEIPIFKSKPSEYNYSDQLIPIYSFKTSTYNTTEQKIPIAYRSIPIWYFATPIRTKVKYELLSQFDKIRYGKYQSTYIKPQGTDNPLDRSYIGDVSETGKNYPKQAINNNIDNLTRTNQPISSGKSQFIWLFPGNQNNNIQDTSYIPHYENDFITIETQEQIPKPKKDSTIDKVMKKLKIKKDNGPLIDTKKLLKVGEAQLKMKGNALLQDIAESAVQAAATAILKEGKLLEEFIESDGIFYPAGLLSTSPQKMAGVLVDRSVQRIKKWYLEKQMKLKDKVFKDNQRKAKNLEKSTYEGHNLKGSNYFEQFNKPIEFVLRTTIPSKNTQTKFKFGINSKESNFVIVDPLSYQVESYKTSIYKGNGSFYDAIAEDKNFKGNLIKFWIKNMNNNNIMTTPAFLTELQDTGGSGVWDQLTYVNSYYPKFVYKGTEKRVINFVLKLACFDKEFLPQYIEKLNFFRTVGFPYYQTVSIPRTNDFSTKSTDQTVSTLNISLGRAPIYSLTLGDIVYQQEGFFESCELSWEDEQSQWNLDPRKLYGVDNIVGNQAKDIIDKIKKEDEAFKDEIEIPIITNITCAFVCLYGRGPSSGEIVYKANNTKDW